MYGFFFVVYLCGGSEELTSIASYQCFYDEEMHFGQFKRQVLSLGTVVRRI